MTTVRCSHVEQARVLARRLRRMFPTYRVIDGARGELETDATWDEVREAATSMDMQEGAVERVVTP